MTKLSIIVDGDEIYPIYRENGSYFIDLGGSFGMSGPLSYPSDTKAISELRKAFEEPEFTL